MPTANIQIIRSTGELQSYLPSAVAIGYLTTDGLVYIKDQLGTVRALAAGTAESAQHLILNTVSDDKQVRINSRSFTQASGDSMAFQAKPSQTVTTTGSVQGGQISPRLQAGIAAASLIGLHIDTDMKGATGGDVSGDVRGMEIEMVSDASSGRTIAGDVQGIRFRTNLDATVTGHVVPIYVLSGEAAGGQWDAFVKFSAAIAGVVNHAPGTEPTTADGYIKVLVGSNVRYIQLYSGAPVD